MIFVGKVRDHISDNVGVGGDIQGVGHPVVEGVAGFEELDDDAVGTVLPLQEARPGDPDTGEADLDSQTVRYLVSMQITKLADDMR